MPENAFVIRSGKLAQVPASDLVRGDLLFLRSGDKIAADARVVSSTNLKVDNSLLTGESEPVERDAESSDAQQIVVEARCIVFNGTTVASGSAYAIAIRLGSDSAVGKLSKLTESSVAEDSQLSQEMEAAVNVLVTVGLLFGIALMSVSFAQGFGLAVSFEIAIGTFLSFLPQGLPATITTLLTVAAKRMAKKNVLVKNLRGVETLGAITVLATDKTGTLTMNRMEAVVWWDGGGIEPIEDKIPPPEIINVANVCNNIKVTIGDDGSETLIGDATEQGLYRMVQQAGLPTNADVKRLFEIPFSSSSKWHLVIVQSESGPESTFICMKGAPEKILNYCHVRNHGFRERFIAAYKEMGKRGLRVLAFAQRRAQKGEVFDRIGSQYTFKFDNLDFVGMVGLQDPPKPGTKQTIAILRQAGIQVSMITGDHPITATSIARQIGLLTKSEEELCVLSELSPFSTLPPALAYVVHGELIQSFSEKHWDLIMKAEEIIFARTQPHHKLEIVTRFQEYGHIVAVSGDGANDSPALKKADLGISMNKTASDVSKEAADMILLDDNFNTIVVGVFEGRLIFENLKKSIRYTLTHIFPEVSSLAVVAICGIPFPFPALLLLVFDVFCEPGPAISFAVEPAPVDFMKLKPRKPARRARLPEIPKAKMTTYDQIKSLYNVKLEGEKLFNQEMILWCFLQGGIFLSVGCFAAYILTMILNKVPLSSLWRGVNKYFETSLGVDVQDLTLTDGTVVSVTSGFCTFLIEIPCRPHRQCNKTFWNRRNRLSSLGLFWGNGLTCFSPNIDTSIHTDGTFLRIP